MKPEFTIYYRLGDMEFIRHITAIDLIVMFMDIDKGINSTLYWEVER